MTESRARLEADLDRLGLMCRDAGCTAAHVDLDAVEALPPARFDETPMTDPLRGAATITDAALVLAIAELRQPNRVGGFSWVTAGELAYRLAIHPNRVRSKVRRAMKRGLVTGCICGCRGDFELTPAGEAFLAEVADG